MRDRRPRGGVGSALVLVALLTVSTCAFAKCELKKFAEFAVTMRDMRPLIAVKFNGAAATMAVDSGAFFSMITAGTAAEFGLKLTSAPYGLRVTGVGGSEAQVSLTTVDDFSIAGQSLHRIQFLVGGSEVEAGSVGLLGQNILGIADAEYDLANGVIRLIKPSDCRKDPMAYWAKNGDAVGVVDIEAKRESGFHTIGSAAVNGAKIQVVFDTGAGLSMLTLRAAKRAGIKVDDPGVIPAGLAYGIGKTFHATWIAPVKSFALGGEEIQNTKLRIGDIPSVSEADMLLGPDFFLSHRIYVSNEQHKVYFTYNGGPVFNLKTAAQSTEANAAAPPAADAAAQSAADAKSAPATAALADASAAATAPAAEDATPPAATSPAAPGDAAEQSRLGMALAARHDYAHALEDLDRACALAPTEPEYFYQRAYIHMERREGEKALADLDTTLRLKPDHLLALMARAQISLSRGDSEAARADLDAAALAAPKPSEHRYELAQLYAQAHLLPAAIAQYDLWIEAHREDAKIGAARNARCEEKVLLNQDLDNAIADCNAAVRSNPKSAPTLGNRGLAYLRRGDYKKAIDDFDDALKLNPKLVWSLYGRGIAEIRLGKTAPGQADIEAAKAIRPAIAEDTAAYGIGP
jgi:tetratricopeptide (TPR) repeat protein/predicted aspartyl protease